MGEQEAVEGESICKYCKEKLVQEIRYHKFETSHEEITLHLNFTLTLFQMDFNFFLIRHASVINNK